MWEVMCGIIAGEKLLNKDQLISFCYGLSHLLLSLSSLIKSLLLPCRHPEMEPWGLEEERDGGEGRLLKGSSQWVQKMSIITVSNRLDWGERRAYLTSSWSSSLPVSSTRLLVVGAEQQCWVFTAHLILWNWSKEVWEYSAVFALRRPLISLLSMAGWPRGPLICAVGTLGCCLDRLAAGQCDCLIGCPLKAM